MKSFLSDAYRKSVNSRIKNLVVAHKANKTHREVTPPEALRALPPPESVIKHTIKAEQVAQLYAAKCEDLEVSPNEKAKKRFIDQFMNGIKNKSLTISGLGLGPSCIRPLLELIYRHPRYINLDISLNRLQDKGATYLAQFLAIDPPIICVDLRSNAISVDGSVMIFKALARNSHLTTLDMSAIDGIDRNRIGTQGSAILASVLQRNQILSYLNLSMCGISEEGCAFIGPALSKNTSLLYLNLSSNRLGTIGIRKLFSTDKSFGELETLILSHNGINDVSGPLICKQLAQNESLRNLDLSSNALSKPFLSLLFNAFQNGTKLRKLSLASNKFGSDAADSFHLLIRDYPSINHFNLSCNPLKDDTLEQIAEAVIVNTQIEWLDLSDTMMGDKGAMKFANVLESHPKLTYLNLNGNKITDKSGVPIANALAKNTVLITLLMKSNEMKDESSTAFRQALQQNHTITELDLSYNDFTAQAHYEVMQAIKSHKDTINKNIAEIASQHIEKLKEHEQTLFSLRQKKIEEYDAVCAATVERDNKKVLLESLKIRRAQEIADFEKQRDDLRKQYEEISEKRRVQLHEFNDAKSKTEKAQHDANIAASAIASKKEHALSRLKRAEDKNIDARLTNNRVTDELKVHLQALKDQLKAALKEAHEIQNKIFQKEAEAKAKQEEEERLAREKEEQERKEAEAKKKGKATTTAKMLSVAEMRTQKAKNGKKSPSIKERKEKKITIQLPGNPQPAKSALQELNEMTVPVNATLGDT